MLYFVTSLKLELYLLLFVVVLLIRDKSSFFLHCPKYASPRKKVLSAAARLLSYEWSRYSDSQKVNFFLSGSSLLSTEENVQLFSYAQQFIKESNRFCFYLKSIIYS